MSHLAQTVRDVAPHLLWRPMSVKEITVRVGMWSPKTIKLALEELVGAGAAIRDQEPNQCGGFRCRYRRSIDRGRAE